MLRKPTQRSTFSMQLTESPNSTTPRRSLRAKGEANSQNRSLQWKRMVVRQPATGPLTMPESPLRVAAGSPRMSPSWSIGRIFRYGEDPRQGARHSAHADRAACASSPAGRISQIETETFEGLARQGYHLKHNSGQGSDA